MNVEHFNEIVNDTVSKVQNVLTTKRAEYAFDKDVFHNFIEAAGLMNDGLGIPSTPVLEAAGYMRKHIVSILDMCKQPYNLTEHIINEKIVDSINYLILIKAMLLELKRELNA